MQLISALTIVSALVPVLVWRRYRQRSSCKDKPTCLVEKALQKSFQAIKTDPRWDRSKAAIILSGGLDTCIIAEAAAAQLGIKDAFTVVTADDARDGPWSALVAQRSGLRHHLLRVELQQLLDQELPTCVQVLKTFDGMELRNAVAVCHALRAAAAAGFTCAVTGDGADELFGGYSFTHGLEPGAWQAQRAHMAGVMRFCAPALGAHLGVHVASPYLDPAVISTALDHCTKQHCVAPVEQVPEVSHLVTPRVQPTAQPSPATADQRPLAQRVTSQQASSSAPSALAAAAPASSNDPAATLPMELRAWKQGTCVGKLVLRRAFPGVTAAWRPKEPIEVGCGTTQLGRGWFDARITQAEFEAAQEAAASQDGVQLRDAEHLAYYRCFESVFPGRMVPGLPRYGSDPCPACGYQLSHSDQTFCVTCGHYDPALKDRHKQSS